MKNKFMTLSYFIFILTALLLLYHCSVFAAEKDTTILWNDHIIIRETGGIKDSILFGEAINAVDETSPASHDLPKPPPPIPPSVHAFFTSHFDPPYNNLIQDFRTDTKTSQIWNLTIIWIPTDYNSSTNMVIKWNPVNLSKSQYSSIQLYQQNNTIPLTDMLKEESYTYSSPANIPHFFRIECSQTNNNDNNTPFPSIFYFIVLAGIIIFINKTKKQNR